MKGLLLKELVRPYYLRYLYFRLSASNCPPGFKECWDYPWESLRGVRSIAGGAESGRDILLFPMADWHGTMQRSQQLALAFARSGNRCIYQSPHVGREYPTPYLASPDSRLARLRESIHEMHVHLPREPVYHHRPLRSDETRRIVSAYVDLFKISRPRNPLILASFPFWAPVALRLREEFGGTLAYDCHDYLPAFPGVAKDVAEQELALFERADQVIFSSDWLRREWLTRFPDISQRSTVARNAATPADFAAVAAERRYRGGDKVTVGYVGAIAEWFDVPLVEYLIRSRPDWRFVFIGEVASAEVNRIARYPNASFQGAVPYQRLPEQMARFSAAIIPFRLSPLTLAVDPVKLYEYLSAALPVVSAPLPEVARFREVVSIGASPAEFLEALDHCIAMDGPALRALRRSFVQHETWSRRAESILRSVASPSAHRMPTAPLAAL